MNTRAFLQHGYCLLIGVLVYGVLSVSTVSATNRLVPSQYATIQAAINASSNGDVVLVSPGTYTITSSISFGGKLITVKSTDGAHNTTVKCDSTTIDLFVFNNGETLSSKLEGLTLRGGRMAIWIQNSSPFITRCLLTKQAISNWAALVISGAGFGVVSTTARPTILNNTIDSSANGGISIFSNTDLTVKANIVVKNANYGIHRNDSNYPTVLSYNDVWGNPTNYINISNAGTGSFSSDPKFGSEHGLMPGSPCLDSGEPSAYWNDPDGTRNDVGAFWSHQVDDTLDLTEIQPAINLAVSGDIVIVYPGTYTENITFSGKRLVVISRDGAASTTITAENTNESTVRMVSYEAKGTELNGFTITGSNNSGVRCQYSSPRILNNFIQNNHSPYGDYGAGIDLKNTSSSFIKGNVIRWDTAGLYGAGIHGDVCSNDTICYNLFYKNYGYMEVRMLSTTAEIYNNTIDAAGSRAHCISNQVSGTITCRNNIVVNSPMWGIYAANSGYAYANFNDAYSNTSGAFGGVGMTTGASNITGNPLFWATPAGAPEYYDIRPFSPCVDAGDTTEFFNDSDDSRNDMGWKPYYLSAARENRTEERLAKESVIPGSYRLDQNYPNPFNPSTHIAFELPTPQAVRLVVFDILGREVKTLWDGPLTAGSHVIEWDGQTSGGAAAATGVYFYRLSAGDFVEAKKMLLMK